MLSGSERLETGVYGTRVGLNTELRVLHVVSGLAASAGGPSRSVVGLVHHLAERKGLYVTLMTQKQAGEAIMAPASAQVRFHACEVPARLDARLGWSMRHALDEALVSGCIDIVHVHGIWNAPSYWACSLARRNGKKIVLHPRGMLEPWCLRHKAWKKRLAMHAYQWKVLNAVDIFFATAEQELSSIRNLGLRQPVAVVPNGVELPRTVGQQGRMRESGARRALFLSRVHPKKGLVNLVHAWAVLQPEGWRLIVAGPNEGGHWQEVEREIERLGLGSQITYVGPVEGQDKADLYEQSDLFILPTFSENFGIAVAEALSYGLPVITTKGTPWKDLEDYRCGWWVDTGVDPLVGALRQAMALSDQVRKEMGARGRAYVQRYDWKRVAEETATVYRWLMGVEPRPDCVFVA